MKKLAVFYLVCAFALGIIFGWIVSGKVSGKKCLVSNNRSATSDSITKNKIVCIDHILVDVNEMNKAINFYRDIIHLKVKSIDSTFSILSAGNIDVYLSTKPWGWKAPRRKDERVGLGMYPHFEVDSVQTTVELARQAGYKIVQEPIVYDWGTEAFISDNDGYTWALVKLTKPGLN